ncbi:class I SAM-dependent methyltransferase [Kitasatospora acidiphila]|uniref:class I SAM-dependent methyltransferase n=1 Tax=Kitasatospora acidiphila TaxID=2567942 RepID=UPI003C771BF5
MTGASPMTAYAMAEATDLAGTQLRALREAYDPYTTERLAGTGVGPGWRCLEIGAGDGSIARWLAHRVLPGGEVLATDLDTRRLASGAGLRVLRHDIGQDPLPTGEFDLVHARLVLQHVPNRREVLARLRTALRPGGWIQIDEFDTSYAPALLAPDGAAGRLYESYLAAKERLFGAAGARVTWGRECAAELRDAGFEHLDPQPRIFLWRAGHPGLELQLCLLEMLRDRLLANGLTERQLGALADLMSDPQFAVCSPVVYSVQARRA